MGNVFGAHFDTASNMEYMEFVAPTMRRGVTIARNRVVKTRINPTSVS